MNTATRNRRYREIGLILRSARNAAGLKQHEVAEALWPDEYLQTARNRVSDIETGKSRVSQSELNRLALFYTNRGVMVTQKSVLLSGDSRVLPMVSQSALSPATKTITLTITVPADVDVSIETSPEAAS